MNEKYLSKMDISANLRIVGYTKVSNKWSETNTVSEFNRLYIICDGNGFVEVEGKRFFPQTGDFVLIPASKKKSFGTINNDFYLKYWCHFDATVGKTNLFDILNVPYIVKAKDYTHTTEIFRKMVSLDKHNTLSSSLMLKALLYNLISIYIHDAKETETTSISRHDERISKILHYINKNIHLPLSNEILASHLHFHPNHFIRFFKNAMGMTPMKYIRQQRMEKAKEMLISSFYSITEISEKLNYSSVFHFSKSFKEYIGYSPSEYRQHYIDLENDKLI